MKKKKKNPEAFKRELTWTSLHLAHWNTGTNMEHVEAESDLWQNEFAWQEQINRGGIDDEDMMRFVPVVWFQLAAPTSGHTGVINYKPFKMHQVDAWTDGVSWTFCYKLQLFSPPSLLPHLCTPQTENCYNLIWTFSLCAFSLKRVLWTKVSLHSAA